MEKTYDVCTFHYPDSSGEQIDTCTQFQTLAQAKQYAVQLTINKWKNQFDKEELKTFKNSLVWDKYKDMYGNTAYLLQSSNVNNVVYDIDSPTITENKYDGMNIKDVYDTLNGVKCNIEDVVGEMIDDHFMTILENIEELMSIDEKKYSALYDKVRKIQDDLTSILEKNFPNINL